MAVSTIKANDVVEEYVTITGHSRQMCFRKTGRVVDMTMPGDWTSLVHGQTVTVGTIPTGMRPYFSITIPEQTVTGHDVAITLKDNGQIVAYNYLTSDITRGTIGNYHVTYIV